MMKQDTLPCDALAFQLSFDALALLPSER